MAKYQSWCPNQVLGMVNNHVKVLDGITMPVPGKRIRFENGFFETEDPKEVEFIESNWLFGSKIVRIDEAKKKAPAATE